VFLDTMDKAQEEKSSFLFSNFKDVVIFKAGDDLELFFKKLENYSKKGYWLAGYFSYEFGYFFRTSLSTFKSRIKRTISLGRGV